MIKIQKHPKGYVINLGNGRFVKTSIGLRSPVKVWKTEKGGNKYMLKKFRI